MKPLLLLLLFYCLFTCYAGAQNTSWFYGTWTGETYFPNGPITKRIIIRMQVTNVSGNNFTATMTNLYPNDTTVRLQREITGKIINKQLVVVSNRQIYIRDPRTQNFWYDCTACATQSAFSISSSTIEIKITTVNCSDVCDGETTFNRDTSDLTPEQKIQLTKWFGWPANSNTPPAKPPVIQPDSIIAATGKPAAPVIKKDSLLTAKNNKTDTLNWFSKNAKSENAGTRRKKKADSLAAVRKSSASDTLQTKPSPLQQSLKDSMTKQAMAGKDTLPAALTTRTTNLVTTYQVTSPHIVVQLFDNAEIDGDVVSVYHNGKLIVNHQTLTHKAITINIDASKTDSHHEFILIADNLGLTPPNTALMRITAGQQKFELEVSSDFDNNAKIAIDYTGD